MDQFLEECPRCIRTTDDITIHGCTEAEHDAHLHNLMQVAHKYGVVFNPQKMHVKAPAVNFFSCLYNANGVHPDQEKVDAVHTLPAPSNVTKLQEFLGMVTYLSPFICSLSTLTASLWELLKKRLLTSPGTPAIRPLLSKSSKPLSATPPSDTSTCHCLWPYKSMPPR